MVNGACWKEAMFAASDRAGEVGVPDFGSRSCEVKVALETPRCWRCQSHGLPVEESFMVFVHSSKTLIKTLVSPVQEDKAVPTTSEYCGEE